MDKLTSIRIKYNDGTYLDQIPIGVLVQNVGYDSSHNLLQVLGTIDVDSDGTIQAQINKLFTEKVNSSDLDSYVNNQISANVTQWLAANVTPTGSAVAIDKSLSIEGAAADSKTVGETFYTKTEIDGLIGKIDWQIPQGTYNAAPVSVTTLNNTITINGQVISDYLRCIVYGSKCLYATHAPAYANYSNIYLDPINSFIPGHKVKAEIKLISGSYQLNNPSQYMYLDLRNINNNSTAWTLIDEQEKIIDFQPQMILFAGRKGIYNNATFQFSIIDITTIEENPITKNISATLNSLDKYSKQLNETVLNNSENIIFDIEGERYITYSNNNLQGNLKATLHHNLFSLNGTLTSKNSPYNSVVFCLISPSQTNTAQIPTYTTSTPNLNNMSRAYDGIPLESFKIGHKYLIGIELISGTYQLQSIDTSVMQAAKIFIQLHDSDGNSIFRITNDSSNQSSTNFYREWICNKLPDCAFFGLRAGTYNNAVFKIIIKDLTVIAQNIPLSIKKAGLVNISNTGMWLQGTYSSSGTQDGYITSSISPKRIHWAGSLPKNAKYIQFKDPYQVALFGWDSEYNSLKYLVGWNDNPYFYKMNAESINEKQTYYIDLQEIKNYFSNVEYLSLGVRKNSESKIDQTEGYNVKVYVEPGDIPFVDNYIFTKEDFSIGYFSPTYKENIYNTSTSHQYLTTAKFLVHAGDEIEGILDPESNLGFFVLALESDLQENNKVYRSNSGHRYTENFKCYFYEDGYCEISAYTNGEILSPVSLGNNKIILHRNTKNDFEKMNLLIQSRYFDERDSTNSQGKFVNPQPLTLIHFSDNHGSLITLNKIQELLENQDYVDNTTTSGTSYKKMFNIDDVINTGDAIYSYYGYTVDGVAVKDFYDESVSYLIGDYIVYDNTLYQCTENTTGAFNVNHWNLISNDLSGTPQIGRKQYLEHQIGKKSLFVLGNHDTNVGDFQTSTGITTTKNRWHALSQRDAYDTFFASQKDEWGVIQTEGKCYWYKDYQDAKIRLIGIDMSYWDTDEFNWLSNLLAEANDNNYSVILASHSQLGSATGNSNITFQSFETLTSAGKYRNSQNYSYGTYPDKFQGTVAGETIDNLNKNEQIMNLLQSYKDIIICHLHGHWHIDMFEYYDDAPDILAIGVDQGGALRAVYEAERTISLPNWYVFNVITFDTYNKLIKIVRFGNDIDHYLRSKKVLTYDYANKRVVTNY